MTSVRSFVVAAGFAAVTAISNVSGAKAAGDVDSLTAQPWSFKGIFGTFENAEVQRGLQVYLEVCSSCHGLRYIAFRNLAAIGYDEEQIKKEAEQLDQLKPGEDLVALEHAFDNLDNLDLPPDNSKKGWWQRFLSG